MAYYVPPVRKSGGTRPPCHPPNCAHVTTANIYRISSLISRTFFTWNMACILPAA